MSDTGIEIAEGGRLYASRCARAQSCAVFGDADCAVQHDGLMRPSRLRRALGCGQESANGVYEHGCREWLLECVIGADSTCRPEVATRCPTYFAGDRHDLGN